MIFPKIFLRALKFEKISNIRYHSPIVSFHYPKLVSETRIPLQQHFLSTSSANTLPVESSNRIFANRWRPGVWISAGLAISGISVFLISNEVRGNSNVYMNVPIRLGRNIMTATAMISDYYFSLRNIPLDSQERDNARKMCHLRCAERLQGLFFRNGGIYIKIGQHLAQLDHLIPSEYVEVMSRSMLDTCPRSSFVEVSNLIKGELGDSIENLFSEFDPVPIASASLAQVHKAKTKTGQEVAVKVQHSHLSYTAVADMKTVWLIVKAVHWMFPAFDYGWLVDEIQESLPKELNFLLEAENAKKCQQNFAQSPLAGSVFVPETLPSLSSKRILTMEFIHGYKVTDTQALRNIGLEPAAIAKLVSEAFAEMIFSHGFVHCDPHAANMLIRINNPGRNPKPELVLLDHGLYRTLSDELRRNYAGFWQALIFGDEDKIKHYSEKLGIGGSNNAHVLFAGIVTMKSWDKITSRDINSLRVGNSPEERKQIQSFAVAYMKQIGEILRSLPSAVLLLLKTNDCLRSIDNSLGAPVNTYVITARHCTRALFEIEWKDKDRQMGKFIRRAVKLLHLEIRLLTLQWAGWLLSFKQNLGV